MAHSLPSHTLLDGIAQSKSVQFGSPEPDIPRDAAGLSVSCKRLVHRINDMSLLVRLRGRQGAIRRLPPTELPVYSPPVFSLSTDPHVTAYTGVAGRGVSAGNTYTLLMSPFKTQKVIRHTIS